MRGLVLCALALIISCTPTDSEFVRISGNSMEPELINGKVYKINFTTSLKRLDNIVFKKSFSDKTFVKKIYSIPGDRVEYLPKEERLLVEGKKIPFKITGNQFSILFQSLKESRLIEKRYFVFSVNPTSTYDSRAFGSVKSDEIIGVIDFL